MGKGQEEGQSDASNRTKDIQERAAKMATLATAKRSAAITMKQFDKPHHYTGNRSLFDNSRAKREVKIRSFENGQAVKDPYTGRDLVLRKTEAKTQYGKNWTEHLAEADHVVPLEEIFDQNKDSAWLSNDDIRSVANGEENMQTVSRQFNNAKRSRSNKELVEDEKYLEKTGLELSEEAKKKAVETGDRAQRNLDRNFAKIKVENAVRAGHKAGVKSAKSAAGVTAAFSLASNTTAVIKGEKEVGQAVANVVVDTGSAAVQGYITGAGITLLTNTLRESSSEFIKTLARSNVIGEVVVVAMTTGKSLVRYMNNEITLHEMAEEIAVDGVEMIASAIGFSCGGILGSVVAGMVASAACNMVMSLTCDEKNYRRRISVRSRIEEEALQEIRHQRKHLAELIDREFGGWDESFEYGFQTMLRSAGKNDFSEFADGLDQIMSLFHSEAAFHDTEEVETFFFEEDTVFEF